MTKTAAKRPARKATEPARDIYQEVTDSIVSALTTCGEHSRPWVELSDSAARPRSIDGRPYRGTNVLLLWVGAMENGYEHGVWGTYRAWQRKGAQVRKGEKATMVTLWKSFDRKATADEVAAGSADKDGRIKSLVLRSFSVFNVAQVDGYELPQVDRPTVDPIEHADAFFAAVGADVRTMVGDGCYYMPGPDSINMEPRDAFTDAEHYYGVLAHEHGHWTGHKSRLARDFSRFDGHALAAEELVAELTAAFVGSHLGILPTVRDDHASYVKSWVSMFTDDKKAIVTAAAAAQKATDYLLAQAGELVTDEAGEE